MHRLRVLREGGKATAAWEIRIEGEWDVLSCPLPDWEWHHVAGMSDGQVLRLWLDGKVVAEKKHPGTVVRLNTFQRPMAIGSETDGAHRFQGLIDEFRISKVARASFCDGQTVAEPAATAKAKVEAAAGGGRSHRPELPLLDDADPACGDVSEN